MADQNKVLAVLAASKTPLATSALLAAVCGKNAGFVKRKNLLRALSRVAARGYVESAGVVRPQGKFADKPSEGLWRATKDGVAFAKSGARIVSGTKAKRGFCNTTREPLYARFWSALRTMPERKATIPQMVEMVAPADPDKGADVCRKYMKALCRAGVVMKLRNREPGFAPSSNGFARFALMKNLGPKAPLMRPRGLINPNNHDELIAYPATKES